MSLVDVAFGGAELSLISDGDYVPAARALFRQASRRCLCSLFLVDLTPAADSELLVDTLLIELQARGWIGVDTRLLVGGSRTNIEIAQVALTAYRRARQLGINARLLEATQVRGSHVKLIVADDFVLTGSHNWSGGAFSGHIQDSVAVRSPALAASLAALFETQWQRGERTTVES